MHQFTSRSVVRAEGSAGCDIPKLLEICFTTATATSLPPVENLSSTDLDWPQLFSAMTDDREAHSEYIVGASA